MDLHQCYGRLPRRELFQTAIALATNDAPVPQIIGHSIHRNIEAFLKPGSGIEETANALHTYASNGQPPREGDVFRNPDLVRTYTMVAEGGRDAFYDGPTADTIERYFRRIGGWMTRQDLRRHHSEGSDPLVTGDRGVEVYGMAANTQGAAMLQMRNMLEHFDLRGIGFQSAASLQVQIEAKRLTYEDRARYYADPHFSKVPVDSMDYAAEQVKLIRLDRISTRTSGRATRRAMATQPISPCRMRPG